jgi:hypothetical protein
MDFFKYFFKYFFVFNLVPAQVLIILQNAWRSDTIMLACHN